MNYIVLSSVGKTRDRIVLSTGFVLLCMGFVADLSLFEAVGVNLLGEERIPEYDPAIAGEWPTQIGTIESRRYEVPLAQIEAN